MMTTEQIEQEIATLTQQRDNFIQQVNLQVAEQIGESLLGGVGEPHR